MSKRKWKAIARLSDNRTRIAVSLATDPKILACYERGFPHLFTEGDDEGSLHVPLSALMEAAEEFSRDQYPDEPQFWTIDRHFTLDFAGEYYSHLRIPNTYMWEWEEDEIPDYVINQLAGQKAQAGLVVEINREKYVVTSITFDGDCPVEIGEIFQTPPPVVAIHLCLVDFIALDK
ncbi:MAG: hypothetical protein UR53_C0001G0065 [Candidatus Magasanikbacteria bacterium GW2011_GWC2_34_16]|uniref:Uncharacterized protein n=2 Tax=Candidatus Magasanikiibacteriota TaxID=1752731 RepID=A0A0G0HRA9_9BACT|nr:MAG: hypothetical protein UR53_C0001G0065 [Candidatus Magasanikbacteria bacterium GW2011_GWC2_34_16]KKQ41125.1 MAG: hypothetical protein US58_C0005G0050 [Candidatus Magasanikbacteria bacterium GW2011_GWA2_37_8]